MITDSILNFLSLLYKFVIGLVPNFTFIESLFEAKDKFVSFITEFIAYTLYLFNVPVLKLTFGILISYLIFLAGEYVIKLVLKYVTRLL